MTRWFTSDTHFGNERIINYEERPFENLDNMKEILIKNWNQKVKPEDTIYFLGGLGDFQEPDTQKIIPKLNGNKIYLRGKTKLKSTAVEGLGFVSCLEACFMTLGEHDCYIVAEPMPMSAPDTWMIHGNFNSSWKIKPIDRKICVAANHWGYAPVSEKELIEIMDKSLNPWGTDGRQS